MSIKEPDLRNICQQLSLIQAFSKMFLSFVIISYWVTIKVRRSNRGLADSKRFDHPLDAWKSSDERLYPPDFPKAALFLDFAWTPNSKASFNRQSGLRLMSDDRHWIDFDERAFAHEAALKRVLMSDDFRDRAALLVDEDPGSAEAQRELLDAVIDNLHRLHADRYSFGHDSVRVKETGDEYCVSAFRAERPLALVARLVQDDFILLQKRDGEWRFVAGVACFCLSEIGLRGEKGFLHVGSSLERIHKPVPNFFEHMYSTVSRIFDGLTDGQIYWRSNWILGEKEEISPYEAEILGKTAPHASVCSFGRREGMSEEELLRTPVTSCSEAACAEDLDLRVEYQTIRKLPRTSTVVFSVHTYVDPLASLRTAPRAAQMMLKGIEDMTEKTLRYRDMTCPRTRKMIVSYLESCASGLL